MREQNLHGHQDQGSQSATDGQKKGQPLEVVGGIQLFPRLPLPRWKISHKCGEILDTDNPFAWEVAEPIFRSGINQVAILNRPEFVTDEFKMRPESHLLVLQLQGQTAMITDGSKTWLSVGDLACVPAETPYIHTGKPHSPFSYIYITIAADERWTGIKRRGTWVRQYESADYLYLLVRRLLDVHLNRSTVAIDHASRDSYTLVDLLMRETQVSSKQDPSMSLGMRALLDQIRTSPDARWNNLDMAKAMQLSERTFLRAFRQEFGTTPKAMVMKLRMMLARERLETTEEPIKKIARDLGYANRRTFSLLFLEHVGMTPEEFRQRPTPVEP